MTTNLRLAGLFTASNLAKFGTLAAQLEDKLEAQFKTSRYFLHHSNQRHLPLTLMKWNAAKDALYSLADREAGPDGNAWNLVYNSLPEHQQQMEGSRTGAAITSTAPQTSADLRRELVRKAALAKHGELPDEEAEDRLTRSVLFFPKLTIPRPRGRPTGLPSPSRMSTDCCEARLLCSPFWTTRGGDALCRRCRVGISRCPRPNYGGRTLGRAVRPVPPSSRAKP